MASLSLIKSTRTGTEPFKTLVGAVRERCIGAVCAAWVPDSERCKYMELWQRGTDRRDLTTFSAAFMAFEEKLLSSMQKIAFISEAGSAGGRGEDVLVPPSGKLLKAVQGCFVTSLYKALSGMVENAERPAEESAKENDPDGLTSPLRSLHSGETQNSVINAQNQVSS